MHALDPDDLGATAVESEAFLGELADELARATKELLVLVQRGPAAIAGDAPGAARHRAMQQASAMGSELELETIITLPRSQFARLAAQALDTS